MMDFDELTYLKMLGGTIVPLSKIAKCTDRYANAKYTNLLLMGIGRTYYLFQSAIYMLLIARSALLLLQENSTELVVKENLHLIKNSLSVFVSQTGNAKETLFAPSHCRDRGVRFLSFISNAGTTLGKLSNTCLINCAVDSNDTESPYLPLIPFLFWDLYLRGDIFGCSRMVA